MVQFLEGPTIARLADMLLPQFDQRKPKAEQEGGQSQSTARPGDDLAEQEAAEFLKQFDDLSDEDVDALMHRMLPEQGGDP